MAHGSSLAQDLRAKFPIAMSHEPASTSIGWDPTYHEIEFSVVEPATNGQLRHSTARRVHCCDNVVWSTLCYVGFPLEQSFQILTRETRHEIVLNHTHHLFDGRCSVRLIQQLESGSLFGA